MESLINIEESGTIYVTNRRKKESIIDIIIKNRIAEFRKEKGLSQHRLAKAVGLKRRSIMAYENYQISPTLETAYKICQVLEKDFLEVFLINSIE
ncbi:MAG: helix-turn-helix domain-containing protein [Eubacteriales bacterium]|nr:helix-turn-helix domain-containing protein [Eubacteriales bacterium]